MATFNREILTFQLGNYSNFIGAHWWNIQESGFTYNQSEAGTSHINPDVLYREGQTQQGYTTYTPRLLAVDLTGSLKHLPEMGELYSNENDQSTTNNTSNNSTALWDPNMLDVINSERIEKPQFQQDLNNPIKTIGTAQNDYNFSQSTDTWTDYLSARYHPRTINLIKSYQHSENEETFDIHIAGNRVWKDEHFEDTFGDRIRQYIEECHNCQGFQMLFDCHNGFTGLAMECLEYLGDEYGKTRLVMPVFGPQFRCFPNADRVMSESIRLVNIATTYSRLINQCDLILPLSTMSRIWRSPGNPRQFSFVDFAAENQYETAAIIAGYLDTISLRYRLKMSAENSNYLAGFCSDLNNYGRKLAGAALAMPFPMKTDEDLIDYLNRQQSSGDESVPFFTQLSPNTKISTNRVIQSVCIRGIPTNRLKRPLKSAKEQMKMAAYKCDSVSEMFQLYFQCENYASMSHVAAVPDAMPTSCPFPVQIFTPAIGSDGFVEEFLTSEKQNVQSVPIFATAQVSADIADTLETLHREADRIKIARLNCFTTSEFSSDEYKDLLHGLLDFKDIYDDISQL